MNAQKESHVFISYVRENQEQVDRLCQELEQHGVKVWLDRKSIKPGALWKDAIRQAINQGAFFIACFSKEYHSKAETHMNEELTLAIERLRKIHVDREWFIPVLLSECDVPARSIGAGETLVDINWVVLYENWVAGIQRIISLIKPIPVNIQNLISALHSEDRDVRKRATLLLGEIGDPSAVPALSEALKNDNKNICFSVLWALGNIGSDAVHTLIEALKDKDKYIRYAAAKALGNIGAEAKVAIPALIEALKSEDKNVCVSAAWALGNIGLEAKVAVPNLIEAIEDENEYVRDAGVEALRKINTPEARMALEKSREALEKYKQKSK